VTWGQLKDVDLGEILLDRVIVVELLLVGTARPATLERVCEEGVGTGSCVTPLLVIAKVIGASGPT